MRIVTGVVLFVRAMFASRATIVAENLALRHQLGVLAAIRETPSASPNVTASSGSGCHGSGPAGATAWRS
jgi:hypothetical protein